MTKFPTDVPIKNEKRSRIRCRGSSLFYIPGKKGNRNFSIDTPRLFSYTFCVKRTFWQTHKQDRELVRSVGNLYGPWNSQCRSGDVAAPCKCISLSPSPVVTRNNISGKALHTIFHDGMCIASIKGNGA